MPRNDDSPKTGRASQNYGMGSITQKKNGKYLVRVSNGYRRDGSRNVVSKTCATLAEAQKVRKQLVLAAGKSENFGDGITLDEYWSTYFLPAREGRITKAALADYELHYRVHLSPALGWREIDTIRHAEVQALVLTKSRGTAEHVVKTLRAILRDAWLNELLDVEPMRRPIQLPPANPQLDVWSAEHVAAAMERMRGSNIEALWLLMVGAGLRREEAYALYWRDIGFAEVTTITGEFDYHCTVLVDDAVTIADGRKDVKTAFSRRMAVVPEPFASRLHALIGDPDAPICALSLGRVSRAWASMWSEPPKRKDGTSYELTDAKYHMGRMVGSGVPFVPLSRMRATHETIMQSAGVPDTLNARIHGRSEVSKVGYRHYLNPQADAFGAAALAVGDAVKRAQGA